MCLYNEHHRPPELAGTQATLQMLAYNLPFREAALTNCNSLFGCAQLTFPSVNTAHSQINPTVQQDKQQQWVQIHLLTGQCKHSELLSWCQVILQEKAFVSRKSSPPYLQSFKTGNPVSSRLDKHFFFMYSHLITRSFFETTWLFKTSCPRAQGQVSRSWPGPFPPSSRECRIPTPKPKSAICGLQLGKKWPDTPFQVLPLLQSTFLTPLTPSS